MYPISQVSEDISETFVRKYTFRPRATISHLPPIVKSHHNLNVQIPCRLKCSRHEVGQAPYISVNNERWPYILWSVSSVDIVSARGVTSES